MATTFICSLPTHKPTQKKETKATSGVVRAMRACKGTYTGLMKSVFFFFQILFLHLLEFRVVFFKPTSFRPQVVFACIYTFQSTCLSVFSIQRITWCEEVVWKLLGSKFCLFPGFSGDMFRIVWEGGRELLQNDTQMVPHITKPNQLSEFQSYNVNTVIFRV